MSEVTILSSDSSLPAAIEHIINKERIKDPSFEDSFLILDLNDICEKFERWMAALPRVLPFYAVKCNDDPLVLQILAQLGASFDCASKAEIQSILRLDVDPSRIVFSHTVKRTEYLSYAAEKGVDLTVYDSEFELLKIKGSLPNARLLLRIRIPESEDVREHFSSQFGCSLSEAFFLLQRAKQLNLNVVGVHFHCGCGVRKGTVFHDAVQMADQVFRIAAKVGFDFTMLDVGGGFYGHKSPAVPFEEVAQRLTEALDTYFPAERGVKIIAEPGRYFVCSAGSLVMNIIGKKVDRSVIQNESKVILDNEHGESPKYLYFVNEGHHGTVTWLFSSINPCPKPEPLKGRTRSKVYASSVWGPTCNPYDCIFEECMLPELDIGEWLYIENMGAYTISQIRGASFNGMPHARIFYLCSEDCWSVGTIKTNGIHSVKLLEERNAGVDPRRDTPSAWSS